MSRPAPRRQGESWSRLAARAARHRAARLTLLGNRIIVIDVPSLLQGAFHERRETRGGMRWPCVRSRRKRARGRFKPRPAGLAIRRFGGGTSTGDDGADLQTPRAERRRNRRSVVTIAHALSHIAHGAMGLAESPAFRAPLHLARGGMRVGTSGAPAPSQQQGRRSFVFHMHHDLSRGRPDQPCCIPARYTVHASISPLTSDGCPS